MAAVITGVTASAAVLPVAALPLAVAVLIDVPGVEMRTNGDESFSLRLLACVLRFSLLNWVTQYFRALMLSLFSVLHAAAVSPLVRYDVTFFSHCALLVSRFVIVYLLVICLKVV